MPPPIIFVLVLILVLVVYGKNIIKLVKKEMKESKIADLETEKEMVELDIKLRERSEEIERMAKEAEEKFLSKKVPNNIQTEEKEK